jgi:hypothetical protein
MSLKRKKNVNMSVTSWRAAGTRLCSDDQTMVGGRRFREFRPQKDFRILLNVERDKVVVKHAAACLQRHSSTLTQSACCSGPRQSAYAFEADQKESNAGVAG